MEDSNAHRRYVEVNFDGLVGPTHNHAGLSSGNLASQKNADQVSHPRQAALQGLAKMKLLINLGVPQAILLPHPRPNLDLLRQLGFTGTDADVVRDAHRESPRLLAGVYSSSAMWSANAATVSPAPDTTDGLLHITPANLLTQFHRSIEPPVTAEYLKIALRGSAKSADGFETMHHPPLPSADLFADEGAANHLRLCGDFGKPGLEIFVYGRDETNGTVKFPARQARQACLSIARAHGLDPARTMLLRQSPQAIDAGAFHNDVVTASNQDVLLVHRQAFADANATEEIKIRFEKIVDRKLWVFVAEPQDLSLSDAVSTYIFNSQIVTLSDGTMSLIAPLECRDHPGVQQYIGHILNNGCPVKSVHYVDLRQSMHNGGGPACLRLRVVMPARQAELVTISLDMIDRLSDLINSRYREQLSPADLADPGLIEESLNTVREIKKLINFA